MQLFINDKRANNPTWDDVERAFSLLLANKADTIGIWDNIARDDEIGIIASGENNFVTVMYCEPFKHDGITLLNPAPTGKVYELVIGNQMSTIEDKILVSADDARRAFKLFLDGYNVLKAVGLLWQ